MQQHLQRHRRKWHRRLPLREGGGGGSGVMGFDAPAHEEYQRQHGNEQKQPNAGMGGAPPVACDEVLHHRRPDRAGEIIAGRGDGDRDTAPLDEPVRDIGHQRSKARGAADADQQSMGQRNLSEVRGLTNCEIAEAETGRPDRQWRGNAEAIGEPPHQDAAAGKADHAQGERQRGLAASDAEIGLDRRQRHHDRPHADTADGAQQHGHAEPHPALRGIGGVRRAWAGRCG